MIYCQILANRLSVDSQLSGDGTNGVSAALLLLDRLPGGLLSQSGLGQADLRETSDEATRPSRFSLPPALRYPNYRVYWLGLLASVAGFRMFEFSQFWLAYELTGSPLYLGYVGVAQAVPGVVLNLFGGVFADRLDKRRLVGEWLPEMCASYNPDEISLVLMHVKPDAPPEVFQGVTQLAESVMQPAMWAKVRARIA